MRKKLTEKTKKYVRVLKQDIIILDETKNAILFYVPYYCGTYKYGNGKFLFTINSVTGKVHGRRPIDFYAVVMFGVFPILIVYWMFYEFYRGYDVSSKRELSKSV